jgi:Na+-transporting methylmalonyl-CoA/oxaloacetate decarboxylase gamma subunit
MGEESMVDWNLAFSIFGFGLFAVFCSLGILIGAIYGFGRILKPFEKADE